MKLILNVFLFCFMAYAVVLTVLYFFQEKMLFFPGPKTFGDCPGMEHYGATAEAAENIRYYLKADAKAQNWIIIFHGNAGNACDRTYFLDLLKGFNAHLAVFEYPGFGRDSHTPKETLIREHARELVRHIKDKNQEGLPIYLLGESLGTGVATWVATQTDINGLILLSPYTSLARVAQYHYPWAPVTYLMRNKFQADIWAAATRTPAILFHGINDDIIPIRFARSQVLNFKGDKKLVEISGCGHNDMIDAGEQLIQKEIYDFISENS